MNYKSNINSINTNENSAFKIENKNISLNKNFEFLTFDDIIYFIINNFQNEHKNNMIEYKDNINHLQINIYTTKDLIKSTKLLSCLKLKKNIIEENEDGTEMTLNNSNMNMTLNSINIKISFIIKFIFVDQIIDLDSYIYEILYLRCKGSDFTPNSCTNDPKKHINLFTCLIFLKPLTFCNKKHHFLLQII